MIRSKGFTLVELAVALFIIALLLAGALIPLSTQIEVRSRAETQRNMDSIRDAIVGFAQANGRLPCPANGATPAGTVDATTWPTPVGAGAEQWDPVNSVCYIAFGVVPWTTLGVPETDAWGRRLSYGVAPAFADGISLNTWQSRSSPLLPPASWNPQSAPSLPSPANQTPLCPSSGPPYVLAPAPALSSFALCSLGDIAVLTRTVSASVAMGSALPVVFISHGKNGYGAWQTNGIRLPAPVAGSDEAANVYGNAAWLPMPGSYTQRAFYSRSPTLAAGGCVDPTPPGTASASPLCEFDDIVMTISSSTLIARMVAAGKLP